MIVELTRLELSFSHSHISQTIQIQEIDLFVYNFYENLLSCVYGKIFRLKEGKYPFPLPAFTVGE